MTPKALCIWFSPQKTHNKNVFLVIGVGNIYCRGDSAKIYVMKHLKMREIKDTVLKGAMAWLSWSPGGMPKRHHYRSHGFWRKACLEVWNTRVVENIISDIIK
ncbi:MAG: hypothetical protein B6D35_00675 [Candidatus Brocadia sp. UTAMX2]|nr:MAG: hypothetical protein B6D35_00675 [Candidatus Brocadia sp. UTAMX2]